MEAVDSRQKILATLDRLDSIEPEGVNPQAQMALGVAAMMRGHLVAALPEDPAQLDELLLQGALWFLQLRSDGADPCHVAAGAPEPVTAAVPIGDGRGDE